MFSEECLPCWKEYSRQQIPALTRQLKIDFSILPALLLQRYFRSVHGKDSPEIRVDKLRQHKVVHLVKRINGKRYVAAPFQIIKDVSHALSVPSSVSPVPVPSFRIIPPVPSASLRRLFFACGQINNGRWLYLCQGNEKGNEKSRSHCSTHCRNDYSGFFII